MGADSGVSAQKWGALLFLGELPPRSGEFLFLRHFFPAALKKNFF